MPQALKLLVAALLFLAPSLRAQSASETDPGAFRLQSGDMLRISVWREPDLSGEFLVDESGTVVLPLLGPREVTDRPMEEVERELMTEYRAELRNPSINIVPLRRVYILGEVRQPGLYPVDPTISLAGAVAIAGGATPLGDLRKLRIVRNGTLIQESVTSENSLSTIDVRSGDQVFVERRSWLDRNSTFLVSAVLSVTSIVITLIRR